jgi:hypothetical protein
MKSTLHWFKYNEPVSKNQIQKKVKTFKASGVLDVTGWYIKGSQTNGMEIKSSFCFDKFYSSR